MVTFRKVGRFANVAWVAINDGRESGLSVEPTKSKFVGTKIVFEGYQIADFRTGNRIVVEGSFNSLSKAQQRASELVQKIRD